MAKQKQVKQEDEEGQPKNGEGKPPCSQVQSLRECVWITNFRIREHVGRTSALHQVREVPNWTDF